MSLRRPVLAAWVLALAGAAWVLLRAPVVVDLSGFLPLRPAPAEQLLIEQLREGPAARSILIGIEGGSAQARAAASSLMAQRLRADPGFASIANGDDASLDADRRFIFEHRYALSPAVDPERFSVAGLHAALADTVDALASSEGPWVKALVPHDPTGETLAILDSLGATRAPARAGGVWVSADQQRALLVAGMRASGADLEAAAQSLEAIRTAFRDATATGEPARLQLQLSGAPVFAVASRLAIQRAAIGLSAAGALLVLTALWAAYRAPLAMLLGFLPVASAALIGVASVALVFGTVQGTTLGFGSTLIGESVDYSVYFFVGVGALGLGGWLARLWPTVRLGMLVSVCGFASLVPARFPGLAQLGVYSVSGLLAAAVVTRFVLPPLCPPSLPLRDLGALGRGCARLLERCRRHRRLAQGTVLGIAGVALAMLLASLLGARPPLFSRDLASLSPIPPAAQRLDASLRRDLGEADAPALVVVRAANLEAALGAAEQAERALAPLLAAHALGGIESPARLLPSIATQRARRDALPDASTLRARLQSAAAGLPLDPAQLEPFIEDVAAARRAPFLTPEDLAGTSLGAALGALLIRAPDHVSALLLLHATDPAQPQIERARIAAALAHLPLAHLPIARLPLARLPLAEPNALVRLLDLKAESDTLYRHYLEAALRASGIALLAMLALIALARRSLAAAFHALVPLLLAVLTVAAALAAAGTPLTLMHLVGLLLIVAVGSNYTLFFLDAGGTPAPATLAALLVANGCTVLGFGLLCFAPVPVLEALGVTVAPGTALALVYAACLMTPARPAQSPPPSHHA